MWVRRLRHCCRCDGQIDEDVTVTFYLDSDGDGFGDPANSIAACSAPAGYVADNTDCDDRYANISPVSFEDCSDGVDNDCDLLTDCDDSDCSGHTACIPECIPNKRLCNCDGQCGKWESTETCPWDCPSGCASDADCNDGEDCTLDKCIGGQCSSTWPSCGIGDGCCGQDCTSDTDSDCVISACIPTTDCNCNGKCGKKEDKVNCPDCW